MADEERLGPKDVASGRCGISGSRWDVVAPTRNIRQSNGETRLDKAMHVSIRFLQADLQPKMKFPNLLLVTKYNDAHIAPFPYFFLMVRPPYSNLTTVHM